MRIAEAPTPDQLFAHHRRDVRRLNARINQNRADFLALRRDVRAACRRYGIPVRRPSRSVKHG